MLLTLKVKLQPTTTQREKLMKTMETFNQYRLHHRLYYRIREQYKLPAQLTVRAVSKVVDSYKMERQHLHLFNPHGAIVYDERIMGFKGLEKVSLSTLEGRVVVPMQGDYAKLDQRRIRGQADLLYIKGDFYLSLVM
jgi:hypothetical protein